MIDPTAAAAAAPLTATNADEVAKDSSVEKLFAQMVLKEVRKSMPKDGLMGGGPGVEAFYDLFDEHVAEQIAASGQLNLSSDQVPRSHAALRYQRAAPAEAGVWPVQGRVTSGFGSRVDPINGTHRDHHGMDIAAPEGSAVNAVARGTVTFAGKQGGYGNLVIVEHADGTESRYAHLRRIDVRTGDRVGPTRQLGEVGTTGRSTGPHLHLEVRRDGEAIDPATHFGWTTR